EAPGASVMPCPAGWLAGNTRQRGRGSAFRPTSEDRGQATEDRRAGDSRAAHRAPGTIFRGSAFRPTHLLRIGTYPVGLKPDPRHIPATRRAEARPTAEELWVGLQADAFASHRHEPRRAEARPTAYPRN